MAAPTIDELTAGIHRLSGDMQKSRESAEGIVHSLTDLLKTLVPITVGFKLLNTLMGGIGSHYSFAAKGLLASTLEINAQRRAEADHLFSLGQQMRQRKISMQQLLDARFVYAATRDVFKTQVALAKELERVGRVYLGVASALLAVSVKTYDTAVKYNEALLEANASFNHRLALMRSMAQVQVSTGTAQTTLTNATRALVRYGLESKATFEANLKTVVMLHDAIGLSADEAAHLAAVTENYAKASFQEVADVVATLVSQTALAGAEVKNLGLELQRALGVVTPGATNLPQVVQALGGYEAALKEVTGQVGGFQKLVSQLATPEGMMQAGVLGVTPEMIKTREGIDQIMGRFEFLVNRVVGNSEGLNRVWRLETVAKMMNLSREEVSGMTRALELHRTQQVKELTLQQLYAQQVFNLNQGVSRLINSLSAVLQMGLYPFVAVLSAAINWLAGLIQKLVDWKGTVYVAFGVVTVAGIVLVKKLWGVALAFKAVAIAVKEATDRLVANAAAQLASRGAGAGIPGGPAGGAGGLSGAIQWLLTPFKNTWHEWALAGRKIAAYFALARAGVIGSGSATAMAFKAIGALFSPTVILIGILAGIGVIVATLFWIRRTLKDSTDEAARVNRALSQRTQSLEQSYLQKLYVAQRAGNSDEAAKQLALMMQMVAVDMRNQRKTPAEINARMEELLATGEEEMRRGRYTTMFTSKEMNEGNPDLAAYDKTAADDRKKLVRVAEKTQELIKKGLIDDKASDDSMRERYDSLLLRVARDISLMDRPLPSH